MQRNLVCFLTVIWTRRTRPRFWAAWVSGLGIDGARGTPRASLVTLVVARSLVGEPAIQKAGDGQSRLAGRPHSEHTERCASFAQA